MEKLSFLDIISETVTLCCRVHLSAPLILALAYDDRRHVLTLEKG